MMSKNTFDFNSMKSMNKDLLEKDHSDRDHSDGDYLDRDRSDRNRYLSAVFQSGRHSHFYLFSEEESLREALLLLFCHKKNACRSCSGCRSVLSETNGDVFVLRPESESKIRDEQVEAALLHTETKPSGAYRAVVISDAEKMTVKAQNHLLKSLEEAPPNVIYLMQTAYPESLLPTVVSRAIRAVHGQSGRRTLPDEPTELTSALLYGTDDRLDELLKQYKDRRGELLEQLRISVDQMTAICRKSLFAEKSVGVQKSVGVHPKETMNYILLTDEVIRNLEQSGNFDLNMELLISGRNFG